MRMMVLITLIVCGAFGAAGKDAQNADLTLQLRHAAASELLEAKRLANPNEISNAGFVIGNVTWGASIGLGMLADKAPELEQNAQIAAESILEEKTTHEADVSAIDEETAREADVSAIDEETVREADESTLETEIAPEAAVSEIDERIVDEAAEPVFGGEDEFQLDTVSGISLYDSKDEVYRKLGTPLGIEQDEFYSDMETYHYEGLHIAFAGDFLQYVDVEMSRELIIDDQPVEATLDGLVEALGDPDFTAEDGFVFQRDDALIKLFTDQETGEPLYVSFYHIATV